MTDTFKLASTNIALSHRCKAAISTDLFVLNSACITLCQDLEKTGGPGEQFDKSCIIDRRLYSMGVPDAKGLDLGSPSKCFSYVSPSSDHVLSRFEVAYPGECQERCQEHDDCSWFAIAKSKKNVFRCALINDEGLANDMIISSRKDTGSKYCKSRYQGNLVDCAFGAPLCLMDPHQFYGAVDEVFLDSKIEDLLVLSGPAHCAKSSPDTSVEICASLYNAFRSHMDNNYVSPGLAEALGEAKVNNWYGIDRLWGAGYIFNKDQWQEMYPAYGVGWDNIEAIQDIGDGIQMLETAIIKGLSH